MAGQHFAQHFPASIKRMRELTDDLKNLDKNGDSNIIKRASFDVTDQSEAEEKAAAKMFPLNLVSNQFKPSEPESLDGKLFLAPQIQVNFIQ